MTRDSIGNSHMDHSLVQIPPTLLTPLPHHLFYVHVHIHTNNPLLILIEFAQGENYDKSTAHLAMMCKCYSAHNCSNNIALPVMVMVVWDEDKLASLSKNRHTIPITPNGVYTI